MKFDFNKIARTLFYALIFLIPTLYIPGVFSDNYINKGIFFGVISFLIFACLMISFIKKGAIKIRKSIFLWSSLVFLVLVFISTLCSSNIPHAFWGELAKPDSFYAILLYVLTFIFGAILIESEKEIKKTIYMFLSGTIIVSIVFLLQYFFGNFTQEMILLVSNINIVGILSSIGMIILIDRISQKKKRNWFKISLIILAFLTLGATLVIINFNIAWFLLVIGSFVLLWGAVNDKINKSKNPFILFPLILTIIATTFFFGNFVLDFQYQNNDVNLLTFEASSEIINKSLGEDVKTLAIGSGPAFFDYQFLQYKSPDFNRMDLEEIVYDQGVSGYFTLINDLGILGFLSFLFLFAIFLYQGLYRLINKVSREKYEVVMFAVGLCLFITVFLFKLDLVLLFALFLFLGLWTARSDDFKEYNFKTNSKKMFVNIAIISITTFAFISIMYLATLNSLAEYYYNLAFEIGTADKDLAIEKLNKANSFTQKEKTYIGLSQLYLFKADEYLKESKELEAKEEKREENILAATDAIKEAEEYAIKATEINTSNYAGFVNLGNVYVNEKYITEEDFSEQAIEAYKKAIELAPQNIECYENIIKIYEAQENNEEMLKYLDIVVKIDPNNQTYYTKYRNMLMVKSQEELEEAE